MVVTAQRRSERLQEVPITATQISGASLGEAGITATAGLGQMVPAFRLDSNGGYAQPSIRGVSTSISNPGGGSSVGIYVGFYNPSPLFSDFEFLNVDSIQVLKGRQGTLFGRNTTQSSETLAG
jgi:iron complex outermembrane receptor protein